MKLQKFKNTYLLKIEKNEKLLETLTKFFVTNNIGAATIYGIGMLRDVTLGFMQEDGSYSNKTWKETVELTSVSGNLSWDFENQNKPLIHLHATISDKKFQVYGGHFIEATVEGVVELVVTVISKKKVFKKHFGDVPFKTLDLPQITL